MTPPNPFPAAPPVLRIRDLPRAEGVVVAHETDHATAERLAALGLGLGATFTVVRPGDRATVRVGESRIGLGPELSCAVRAVRRHDPSPR
jgi:Fe2+ transport system protein FeoA